MAAGSLRGRGSIRRTTCRRVALGSRRSAPFFGEPTGHRSPASRRRGRSERMDILISGAGIAGLTTAHWLRHYGFSPTIVEGAPSLVTGGYKIDVRGTALDVLHRIGVHDVVVASSTQ